MAYEDDEYFEPEPTPEMIEANKRWQKFCDLLGPIVDEMYDELKRRVSGAMKEAGENPDDPGLYRIRVIQGAYSVNSRAEREYR